MFSVRNRTVVELLQLLLMSLVSGNELCAINIFTLERLFFNFPLVFLNNKNNYFKITKFSNLLVISLLLYFNKNILLMVYYDNVFINN